MLVLFINTRGKVQDVATVVYRIMTNSRNLPWSALLGLVLYCAVAHQASDCTAGAIAPSFCRYMFC